MRGCRAGPEADGLRRVPVRHRLEPRPRVCHGNHRAAERSVPSLPAGFAYAPGRGVGRRRGVHGGDTGCRIASRIPRSELRRARPFRAGEGPGDHPERPRRFRIRPPSSRNPGTPSPTSGRPRSRVVSVLYRCRGGKLGTSCAMSRWWTTPGRAEGPTRLACRTQAATSPTHTTKPAVPRAGLTCKPSHGTVRRAG